ncbi:hypothetical protein PVAP13_2NG559103 [Panicum virgatum]|uniref:Uncharacterized protein n=1 Tax=Panicum virgatum TaxID=38727 RepID=A0A8T0VJ54_PANVG|nr:hypothetical protein PVAP13_2NG559103 [Panicum virgatum]
MGSTSSGGGRSRHTTPRCSCFLVPVPGERQPLVGCHDRRRSTKGSCRPPARPLCLSLLTHAQRTTTPVPAPRRVAGQRLPCFRPSSTRRPDSQPLHCLLAIPCTRSSPVTQSTSLPPCSSLPHHGTSAPASRARSCRLLCFQLLPQPGQIRHGHAAIHRFLRRRAPPHPRGAPHSRTLARHPSELPPRRPLAPFTTVLATMTAAGELPPPVPFSRGGPARRALVPPRRPQRALRCRPPRRQGPAAAAGAPPEAGRGDDVLAGALRGGGSACPMTARSPTVAAR